MFSNNIQNIDLYLYTTFFDNKENGTFIDIGVYNGKDNNISYFFEKNKKWFGFLLQGNNELIPDIKVNRKSQIINLNIQQNNNLKDLYVDENNIFNQTYNKNNIKSDNHIFIKRVQTIPFNTLISLLNIKKIDLLIINNQGNQEEIVKSISNSFIKPDIIAVQINNYNKLKISNHLINFYIPYSQKNGFLIFKRKYNILLNTRCSRINNLPTIYKSIKGTFDSNQNLKYTWYITIDGMKIDQKLYLQCLQYFSNDKNIIIKYKINTKRYCYASEFLNETLNDVLNVDYCYILDDDNILHNDFCNKLYQDILNNEQTIVFNLQNFLGDINPLSIDCRCKIDSANFLIRYDILKKINGYQLAIKNSQSDWGQDALTFRKLIMSNINIKYTHKTCGYYNFLRKKRS